MFSNILVPTDFSAPSDAALEYARTLARKFNASLHLLHVVDDNLLTGEVASEVYIPELTSLRAAVLKEAEDRLGMRMPASDRKNFRGTVHATFGSGARTIVDYAARNNITLIVMGTHGRSGLAHLFMGSVAERVVRSAPCPVLTVRQTPVSEADTRITEEAMAGA